MSDIKEIIFEDINDDYGYGKYGGFEVILNKKTGYINATKLCKDGGKELSEWKRFNHSKKFIDYLSSLGYPKELIVKNMSGDYITRGTYVHPKLIPHIASWVSPEFALKVSDIVEEYIIKEYRDHIRKMELGMKEKDDNITELKKIIERMEQQQQMMREENKRTLREIQEENKQTHNKLDMASKELNAANDKLDVANENINILVDKNKETHYKLDVANENIVIMNDKLDVANENIVIMNDKLDVANENTYTTFQVLSRVVDQRVPFERVQPPEEPQIVIYYTDPEEEKPYRVCRGQKRRVDGIIRSVKEEFPNAREVVRMKKQPNPVESWNACKRELTRNMEWEGSRFNLIDIEEKEFLERIDEIVENVKREPAREVSEIVDQPLKLKNDVQEIEKIEEKEEDRRKELFMMKLDQLKTICKERKIKGYSKLRKDQIVELILDNE